jgi:hypothetical protein
MSLIDDLYHNYNYNGTIFGATDYSDSSSSSSSSRDEDEGNRRAQEADKWREEKEERIQESRNKSAREIAELEAKSRKKLQQQQDSAAMERLQAEIGSRLQISNNEITAQMARLEKELAVRREDIANTLTISRERLGFDREKLAADVQVERDRLGLAREEMERIGIPKMEADRWYQEQQVILAQEAQKIDRERIGVERGRLGLDAFTKAVELASSPASRYQFGDFAAGLANSAEARNWFGALEDAVNQSGFGVASDAGVQPMTPQQALASMMGFLTGQPATPVDQAAAAVQAAGQQAADFGGDFAGQVQGPVDGAAPAGGSPMTVGANSTDPLTGMLQQMATTNPALQEYLDRQNQELGQIAKIADAGASALAPGSLERLGETGLAEFVSGLKKLRRDDTQWLRNYQMTRPSQGAGPEASWTGQ